MASGAVVRTDAACRCGPATHPIGREIGLATVRPAWSTAGEHVCAAWAAFIFLVPPVPGRWVTVPGPGERYAAGSWPLRASSRATILATAAACEPAGTPGKSGQVAADEPSDP